MKRIITYDDLPIGIGKSIYLRMETDPKLYISLLSKGYKIVNHIDNTNESTIYVTGKRQDYEAKNTSEYKEKVNKKIENSLLEKEISKPKTYNFSYNDLINYKYKLPFVLKNENQNGGREKFLIKTEEDYENLIDACTYLLRYKMFNASTNSYDVRYQIDYDKYFNSGFTIQEYIKTPTEYNTTVRLLTSSSNDLLYASLKYNKPEDNMDDTTLLGYLLHEIFPLSTKTIVSNTLSGGENILIGEDYYDSNIKSILDSHNINSEEFDKLIESSKDVHEEFEKELGIICGFDYIYDKERENWYLLEYHSRPMLGDYSKRQGISYNTLEDRLSAEGRVRATALSLKLKKR